MYGETRKQIEERHAEEMAEEIDALETKAVEEARRDLCCKIGKAGQKAAAAALKWHRPRIKGIYRHNYCDWSNSIAIGIRSPALTIEFNYDPLSWADRPEEEMVDYVTKMSNVIIGHLRAFKALEKRKTKPSLGLAMKSKDAADRAV